MKYPKDITAIKLKNFDELDNNIEFLNCDLNYLQRGYEIYKNIDVFTVEHPLGDDATSASGRILKIFDYYEFEHNIDTEVGSSGCPIILNNNNINLLQVIGIHKSGDKNRGINCGTFIGELINEINNSNNNLYNNNKINNNNYIIAEIFIKDEDINEDIRIINSYEEQYRKWKLDKIKKKYKNEKEIKECEIKINGVIIPFNYYYKFKNKGKYTIKYTFKNYLTRVNYLFSECSSLTNINLSNFDTQNVTNMGCMFFNCKSLININLSNFNTKNVTDMVSMFFNCSSLTFINLSNFDTRNVIDMRSIFSYCTSLTFINLSNFNTQNVTYMGYMFSNCSSLIKIDLSNFNTKKVIDMEGMFSNCSSLININLFNFNSQNVTNMNSMFDNCSSLKIENVVTKDNNIIKQLKKDINFNDLEILINEIKFEFS